jgi:hypothetical protein
MKNNKKRKPKQLSDDFLSYGQSVHAEKGGIIENVFQAIITLSNRAWILGILIITVPLLFFVFTYFYNTRLEEPIFMNINLIGGKDFFLVQPNNQVTKAMIPSINDTVSNFISQNEGLASGQILWPSVEKLWIQLTSPVGREIIINNLVEIKTKEFIPVTDKTVQCVLESQTCQACGGGTVSTTNVKAILPIQANGVSENKALNFDTAIAYDLEFPHIFQVDINYIQNGFYKISVIINYTYQGQSFRLEKDIDYLILGIPVCGARVPIR